MERNEVMSTQSKKLDNLSKEQNRPLFQLHNTVRLLDVEVPVPKYVLDTLSMGPKNSVLTKFDSKGFLAEMDLLLNNLQNPDVTNETINDINIATLKYVKNCSKQKIPRHVKMTNRFLKENALLAVPFDKGTGICVMKENTYQEKMNDILNLSQFVKETPTRKNAREVVLKEEERINSELITLNKNSKIDDKLLEDLRSTGGQLPRLYGTAKVHKQNVPMRPVLSMPSSPYYNIAKRITEWLSVVPQSKINSSAKKTVDQLKDIELDEDEVMISFDVKSLYTN
eukprot:TCONS_00068918-protein